MKTDTKLCRFCVSEIPKKASNCAQCGKDVRNGFQRHPFLTIVVLPFVLWMVYVGITDKTPSFKDTCSKEMPYQICSSISEWDGAYRPLVEAVQETLKDPSSFEHISTSYNVKDDYVVFFMRYSATNSFGARIAGSKSVKIDKKTFTIVK